MAKTTKKSANKKNKQSAIPEFKITAQPDVIKGVYSNVAAIHHTQYEFIIDFLLGVGGERHLVSRVILSPQHALALKNALEGNIKKFEGKFGNIKKEKYFDVH